MTPLFRPHPGAQERFMAFTGRYALFGGAAGGGKSLCLMFDPFRQIMIETERVRRGDIAASSGRVGFFRRTMPELREVLDRAKRMFPSVDPGVEWKEQEKTFTFSCGYKYLFGQMEDEGDWIKYYGFEFTEVIFDELTSFTEEQFDQLDTRVRSADPVLSKMLAVRAGTNPVGVGLEWVRRRFVEPAPPNTIVRRCIRTPIVEDGVTRYETVERDQIFIPARLSDNPSIDQADYAATLTNKSSATRRALLEGDWYVSQGSFFADLWDPALHVCKPFKVPQGWYKFRSGDFGTAWPSLTSVQWWAVDPDGNMTCYRSLTLARHNSKMLAYRIREAEIDNGEWDMQRDCSTLSGPLDYSCWNKDVGPSIAESMMEVGVHWFKCTKDRASMADQMRIRLAHRGEHPTLTDKAGKPLKIVPGIRWFDTCWSHVRSPKGDRVKVGPIVTIPVLPSDQNEPDKWDTDGNDHDADSAGYACMSRPVSGIKDGALPIVDDDDMPAPRRREHKRTSYGTW